MTALNFGLYIGLTVLAACMIAVAYRILTAPTDADRAVSADLRMFSFTGMLAFIGVLLAGQFFFDLILVASVVGFVSAIFLARALYCGGRLLFSQICMLLSSSYLFFDVVCYYDLF